MTPRPTRPTVPAPGDHPAGHGQEALLRTVVRVVTALRSARVRFALTGGCAVYAHGGPTTQHDVDVLVREHEVPVAVRALVKAGMRAAEAPEDWLAKVFDGERMVDLLYRPNNRPVTDELLDRAAELRVGAVTAPVASATDLLIDKLQLLGPHRCDFVEPLAIARALREQIDWPVVRRETAQSPYAEAFLLLVRRLALADTGVPRRPDVPGTEVGPAPEGRHRPMGEPRGPGAPQYDVARLHRALAEDPRTAELGVHVTVRGDQVFLHGDVASAHRRAELDEVVHEVTPGLRVHNDVRVVGADEPSGQEELR